MHFLFDPETMMLLGPIEVDGAIPHRFDCALHADRSDVDVRQHDGHEQHRYHAMDHLDDLHAGDVGDVKWKHQQIAGGRHDAAAEHDDPVDHLLAGIEPVGRRMFMPDNATAFLKPLDVHAIGNIAGKPHQEDDD